MMWKILVLPVALASIVPFLQTLPSISKIDGVEDQLSIFSRGVQVEHPSAQDFQDIEEALNNTMYFDLFKRLDYVPETTAPPSTAWQGVNGVQWDDWSQDVVVKAWKGMMNMTRLANATLSELLPDTAAYQLFQEQTSIVEGVCQAMKKDPTRNTPAYMLCYRSFLAANNYAYGQLFAADPERLPLIVRNFERIITETTNLQGTGDGVPNAQGFIRDGEILYLTMGPALHNVKTGNNFCDGTAQAFAVPASGTQEFSADPHVSQDSYIIHFCPPFFLLPRMEVQITDLATGKVTPAEQCNLNSLDSGARALLHEVTHLPWVLNTNYDLAEKYGYLDASKASIDPGANANQTPRTKKTSSKNADSYAWMAVYNYWNAMKECKGTKYTGQNQILGSCNTDVWPSTPDATFKPIKNQWNNYAKEK